MPENWKIIALEGDIDHLKRQIAELKEELEALRGWVAELDDLLTQQLEKPRAADGGR